MVDPWELVKRLTDAIQPLASDPCKPTIADCRGAMEVLADANYQLEQRAQYVPAGFKVVPEE